jgi:hypothetical protein
MFHSSRYPIGQTRVAVLSCPHCSYLVEGTCVICENDDPHPACESCVDGRLPPVPWYQRDLFLAIATSTVVAISSAIIVTKIRKYARLR